MATVLESIKRYQYIIEKCPEDEHKILKCINRLSNLNVTVQHLQDTGVGRTINALRKEPGTVGPAARSLVQKWKEMVAAEGSDEEGYQSHETSTHNGHGSGRESDDNRNQDPRSNISTSKLNGTHCRIKREYHNSEDEESSVKRSKYEYDDYNKKSSNKIKHEETSRIKREATESDSYESDGAESVESNSSESSAEHRKAKKPDKKESSRSHKSSKHSSDNYHSDHKRESSNLKKPHESEKHSEHQSSRSKERHSSDKSEVKEKSHSSHKHKSSHDDKHIIPEKKQKSEHRSSDSKISSKESKSSSKHSHSDKHESSEKHKSSSEKNSSKSDKHRSSSHSQNHDKEKQKPSEADVVKQKCKDSNSTSKEKHSSSSKEKSKDKHSSKEKSSSSNEKQTSSDNKSRSSEHHRSKSERHEGTSSSSSAKKSKHKSNSLSEHKSDKSSSKPQEEVPKKKEQGNNEDSEDGIDCGSGASFAEALGMISPAKPKKKLGNIKDIQSPNSSFNNDLSPATLLAPTAKLAPLPPLEITALPEISPNYRPRQQPKFIPHFSDEDAIQAGISSKNQRTKVYSGNKVIGKIPSLYEMCVHILQEHIDALEFTGGVPYNILKPVVDRATPQQLFTLEHFNPYLMEDTDHLWQKFCEKSFRNKQRHEMETWREMYLRCQEEQEHRLKSLTANIKIAQEAKKAPIKQTKMAYVDTVVKPPRNIARKQALHGTAHASTASPAARVASLASAPNVARAGSVRPPPTTITSSAAHKPKKAPLMQKALQFMRGRKR